MAPRRSTVAPSPKSNRGSVKERPPAAAQDEERVSAKRLSRKGAYSGKRGDAGGAAAPAEVDLENSKPSNADRRAKRKRISSVSSSPVHKTQTAKRLRSAPDKETDVADKVSVDITKGPGSGTGSGSGSKGQQPGGRRISGSEKAKEKRSSSANRRGRTKAEGLNEGTADVCAQSASPLNRDALLKVLVEGVDESWMPSVGAALVDPQVSALDTYCAKLVSKNCTIYPPPNLLLNAFRLTP